MFMSRRVAAQRRHIDQPSMDATTTSAGLEPPSVTMETTKVDSQSADDGSSNDTATSTTTNTVKTTTLLHFHHLPTWRQDNAYILTSYRAESRSYVGSLRSIVSHVHNESVNIWTHLAGAVAFPLYGLWLWRVVHPRYESADAHDVLVFSCFFVGALLCLVLSAACHTLMNHSPEVARWGNKLDYAGIVCLIVGSYMPALYYGFYCDEALMLRYMMLVCE